MNYFVLPFALPIAAMQGGLAAVIPAYVVSKTTAGAYPYHAAAIGGAIVGAVVGFALVKGGRTHRNDLMLLWNAPALWGGGIGLLQAGCYYWPQGLLATAAILVLLGAALIIAALLATKGFFDLPRTTLVGHGLLVGVGAILVFGLFSLGRDELTMVRNDDGKSATFTYIQRRWLGAAVVRHETHPNVAKWTLKFDIDVPGDALAFWDANEKQRLLIPGDYGNESNLASQAAAGLQPFLDSGDRELAFSEPSPYMPLTLILATACGVAIVALAFYHVPDVEPTVLETTALYGATGIATICVFIFACGFAWQVIQWRGARELAEEELKSHGARVDRSDIHFRDQRLASEALTVKFADPEFGDAELRSVAPLLDELGPMALDLSGTKVTDEGIKAIKFVSFLKLDLRGSQVGNEVLNNLYYNLPWLDVRDTGMTAAALRALPEEREGLIERIMFTDPSFTADSLSDLSSVKGLRYTLLSGSQVTPEELQAWNQKLVDAGWKDFVIELDE